MPFGLDHSFFLLYHVDIVISEGFYGSWLLVIHAAQSQLSRYCEMC